MKYIVYFGLGNYQWFSSKKNAQWFINNHCKKLDIDWKLYRMIDHG